MEQAAENNHFDKIDQLIIRSNKKYKEEMNSDKILGTDESMVPFGDKS